MPIGQNEAVLSVPPPSAIEEEDPMDASMDVKPLWLPEQIEV